MAKENKTIEIEVGQDLRALERDVNTPSRKFSIEVKIDRDETKIVDLQPGEKRLVTQMLKTLAEKNAKGISLVRSKRKDSSIIGIDKKKHICYGNEVTGLKNGLRLDVKQQNHEIVYDIQRNGENGKTNIAQLRIPKDYLAIDTDKENSEGLLYKRQAWIINLLKYAVENNCIIATNPATKKFIPTLGITEYKEVQNISNTLRHYNSTGNSDASSVIRGTRMRTFNNERSR